jgi:dipeptidyl aminopeptidase/acylaminoacyl peptidase
MNKTILFFIFGIFSISIYAQNTEPLNINSYLITDPIRIEKPLFSKIENIKGETFADEDLLKNTYLQNLYIRPSSGDMIEWRDLEMLKWKKQTTAKNDVLKIKNSNDDFQLAYLAFYIQNSEWADLKMTLTSAQMLEVYVDGQMKKGKYSWQKEGEEKALKINLNLEANNHVILIKSLYSKKEAKSWSLSCSISKENKNNTYSLTQSLNPELFMDINHLMNGVDIQSAKLSAEGEYYFVKYKMTNQKGKNQNVTDVRRLSDHQTVQLYYGSEVSSLQWSPMGNKLNYTTNLDGKTWIWEYNLDNGKRFPIATDLKDFAGYSWSPNGEYMILMTNEKAEKNTTGLKKIEGMPDHWPWYRSRSNLIILDYLSGVKTPLTHGYLSNNLQDISYNGRYILFSQHIYEYNQRPYGRQILMQYDRLSSKVDTIWNKLGSGSAQYSPDAKQLLVTAGPAFFGEIGTNLTKDSIPNDYDTQAYIYSLSDAHVTPISRDFNPSINRAYWSSYNPSFIYFTAANRTYVSEYAYSISSQSYTQLDLGLDVINSTDFSKKKPLMIYYGSSISTPKQLMMANMETQEHYLIDYPEENFFKDVAFGKTEDWNFMNKDSIIIEGRLYYPPHFDASKKYPMIVYYYGGTSPTERNFRGRYPKNLFAANGYIVYVLQPSGATGYGQDFSAQHVNNWGKTVANEIIQGSRKLCQTHSFIDSTKVGCMGASYGGFMTMYLTTQTDFFSAAIAHAGISSISSYWGEGYWGYLYSEVASANSFPWNNKDLYVNQSPLFQADKVHTPILLLHGNSDTNVPPGESRQFYAALKLLNRDVELIEIDKQDHHIVDYKKRILWQKTILAWFDKNLKGQSDWWFSLYPKKNL